MQHAHITRVDMHEYMNTITAKLPILNPINFSPIGNKCQNGRKNLEDQYSMSSSLVCAYHKNVSEIK